MSSICSRYSLLIFSITAPVFLTCPSPYTSIFQASATCHEYRLRLLPSLLFSVLLRTRILYFCTSTEISSFTLRLLAFIPLRSSAALTIFYHLSRFAVRTFHFYFRHFFAPPFFLSVYLKNFFCTLPNSQN